MERASGICQGNLRITWATKKTRAPEKNGLQAAPDRRCHHAARSGGARRQNPAARERPVKADQLSGTGMGPQLLLELRRERLDRLGAAVKSGGRGLGKLPPPSIALAG